MPAHYAARWMHKWTILKDAHRGRLIHRLDSLIPAGSVKRGARHCLSKKPANAPGEGNSSAVPPRSEQGRRRPGLASAMSHGIWRGRELRRELLELRRQFT